jgi:hypothetical protein
MSSKTPTQLLSFRLPNALPSLKHTCTRSASGHCLGTFELGRKRMLFAPPPPRRPQM